MKYVFSLAFLMINGCDLSCTEIGCASGLTVELDFNQTGEWDLEVEGDDVLVQCAFTLPAEDSQVVCTSSDDVEVYLDLADDGGQSRGYLRLNGFTPETVSVSAWVDGEVVEDTVESPEYSEYYPNGERCDRDSPCVGAAVELELG